MEIPVDEIKIGHRFRKKMGDLKSLAQSIDDIGLLHPVVVTPDNQLIAGYRRLRACKEYLHWQTIPVRVVDLDDLVRGEHDENVYREPFVPSEAVALAKALEPLEKERAKDRQRQSEGRGRKKGKEAFLTLNDTGQTRDKLASCVGMSGRTLEKAKEVVEAAEEEPEKFSPLVEEMDKTGRVSGVYRKLKIQRQVEEIAQEPPSLPTGPFRVIVVDPPWAYEKRATDPSHRAALPYPSLAIEEIEVVPVQKLAADDAILWLWATNAHLEDAFHIVRAWGFEYKTLLTWVKDRMGTGDWLRGQTEHCLLAVRGKPVVVLTNQTTILHAPVRDHSRKPDEFYKMVEQLCPGSKVELFARVTREGWTAHGSETTLFNCVP